MKNFWRSSAFKEVLAALIIGLGLAFTVHLVFGEEFVTRQQARAYAPFAGWLYGTGQRDKISVVTIDDASLAAAGQTWPAKYSYTGRLLRAVAQYQPKAVFLDVYFRAERDDPSLSGLLEQVCSMKAQGIPVKLAAARDAQGAYVLRPQLEALAGRCFDKVAVRYQPDVIDQVAWTYPAHTGALPSAALSLAHEAGVQLHHGDHPLALTWGLEPAPQGLLWRNASEPDASYCRLSHGLSELLVVGVRQALFHDTQKPICVFHPTISAAEFAGGDLAQEARLRAAIEGKFVLIGLATSDSNDYVLSPLHARIPGVYLHATALDNLLQWGSGVPSEAHMDLSVHALPQVAFLMFNLLVVLLAPRAWRALGRHAPWLGRLQSRLQVVERLHARERHRLAGIAYLLGFIPKLALTALMSCGILWLGQRVFGLAYLSVIGIVFLTVAAEWFEFNQHLLAHFWPEQFSHQHSTKSSHQEHA